MEREWKETFGRKKYEEVRNWREKSQIAILDEVYSERLRRTSWYNTATWELKKQEEKDKERQRQEQERIRKAQQEEQRRIERAENERKFKEALEHSEMVAELVRIIDGKQYQATEIVVSNTETVIFNEDEVIQDVTYKRYGYPNLEDYQVPILTEFLVGRLALKFDQVSSDTLELNDAPGGIRTSW